MSIYLYIYISYVFYFKYNILIFNVRENQEIFQTTYQVECGISIYVIYVFFQKNTFYVLYIKCCFFFNNYNINIIFDLY